MSQTFKIAELLLLHEVTGQSNYRNRGCNWTTIWSACQSPVYSVVDEEGNNVADAKIRHFAGIYWLYVDETDGYIVMDEDQACDLVLTNP
jgi:hypothetical protein